jgi:hypothetical protein
MRIVHPGPLEVRRIPIQGLCLYVLCADGKHKAVGNHHHAVRKKEHKQKRDEKPLSTPKSWGNQAGFVPELSSSAEHA